MLFLGSGSPPVSVELCELPTAPVRIAVHTMAVSLSTSLRERSDKRAGINANRLNYERAVKLPKLGKKKNPCLPAGRSPPKPNLHLFS